MTNREWLESLDNAKLAAAMLNLRNIAPYYFYAYTDTAYGITIWLEKEYEDDKN